MQNTVIMLGHRAPVGMRWGKSSCSTTDGSSSSWMRSRQMHVAQSILKAASRPSADTPRSKQKGSLRLFLDSADISMWEKYQNGSLYGFTTNPLILSKDKVPCTLTSLKKLVETARRLQVQELQVQAWGGSAAALQATAQHVLDLDPPLITIKLPCTPDGLTAASSLMAMDDSISITITGVYAPHQVLLAQAVGADYVAPYLGRMADAALRQMPPSLFKEPSRKEEISVELALEAVTSMQAAVASTGSNMRVLVASIRAPEQMAKLAAHGCNTFTFSPAIMEQLCCVPETLQAAADFETAAAGNSAEE